MNHRDQGRTRWWCVIDRVPLPTDGSVSSGDNSLGAIDLSNPRVQAAARTMLRELAQMSGNPINLDSATLENLEITGRRN
jgi:hypothetical protein